MNKSTIGVLGTNIDTRTERDMMLQHDFSCKRPDQKYSRVIGNGFGVLGSDIAERSDRDKMMLSEFSCSASREGYCGGKSTPNSDMIYPRSVRDQEMLKEFNSPCREQFQFRNHYSQQKKIHDMNKNMQEEEPYTDPYNSSTNITYLPIR